MSGPERIWIDPAVARDNWADNDCEGLVEYIRADIARAETKRAMRGQTFTVDEAAEWKQRAERAEAALALGKGSVYRPEVEKTPSVPPSLDSATK